MVHICLVVYYKGGREGDKGKIHLQNLSQDEIKMTSDGGLEIYKDTRHA